MVRKCGKCDSNITRAEAFIDCSACRKSYHFQCSDLFEDAFDTGKDKNSNLKWFCRLCNDHVTEVLSNFEKFKKFNEEMRKLRTDMENKLLDFEVRIQNCETVLNSAIERVVDRKLPTVNAESDTEKELIEKKTVQFDIF